MVVGGGRGREEAEQVIPHVVVLSLAKTLSYASPNHPPSFAPVVALSHRPCSWSSLLSVP